MNIGIIGRHAHILSAAISQAQNLGHTAVGTHDDNIALAWLAAHTVDALVIGGGVEPASRAALVSACKERGVKPLEVFGPQGLTAALLSL
jgi:hypothetical protein